MKIETVGSIEYAAGLDVAESMSVTQNVDSAYVVELGEEKKLKDDAIVILKILTISEQNKKISNVYSSEQLLEEI